MSEADAGGGDRRRLFPLRLCEVLEGEYIALRGLMSAAPDWLLHPEDICLEELVIRLRASNPNPAITPVYAIRERLEIEDAKILSTAVLGREGRGRLLAILNKLLQESADLYDHLLLGNDSEAFRLAELRRKVRQISKDEQTLLNRLLLEAAFPPNVIKRVDKVRRARLFQEIHMQREPERIYTALCLSGGGIRSGAFALGVLQGLARYGILEKFDFLSTVSGGGYVGSWLSTWIHRHPRGLPGVVEEMKAEGRYAGGNLGSEPEPIRFLRTYSHFLNPRAGLFSGDTWTWIGIYLRNLFLNWLIIIPALLLLLALTRTYGAMMRDMGRLPPETFPALFLFVSLTVISTLVCITVSRPSLRDISRQAGATGRTQVRGRGAHLVRGIDQQSLILGLGVVSFPLFCIFSTLLAWHLSGPGENLQPRAAKSGGAGSLEAFLWRLSVVDFWDVVMWGMSMLLVAWLISMALLPERDWRKRLKELVVLLGAGMITWLLIAKLMDWVWIMRDKPEVAFHIGASSIYPAHLYAILAVPAIASVALLGMAVFIGAVSKFDWIEDEDREWWGRFGAWALVGIVAWVTFGSIAILGPPLLLQAPVFAAALGGISGLVALLIGKSSLTAATLEKAMPGSGGIVKSILRMAGINAVAALSAAFLVAFLAFVSLLGSVLLREMIVLTMHHPEWLGPARTALLTGIAAPAGFTAGCNLVKGERIQILDRLGEFSFAQLHLELTCQTPFAYLFLAAALLLAVVVLANYLINLNKFSLHAVYRIRIIRTFLGASRQDVRQPNSFTGFDPLDNIPMHELQPGLLREGDFKDLDSFVAKLHQALVSKIHNSPAGALVKILCSPEHDRSGVLRSRLKSHDPDKPVLKSLQQDLLEAINRVLQTAWLSEVAIFKRDEYVELTDWYAARGNLIFANRLLIDAAFADDIRKFKFPPPPPRKLIQVINLTLNLVRGGNLAWQERKAAPFSVSPMHVGSYYLGYRPTRDYGGKYGISLGTAAAISGAAVSPAMGYSSSPVTALLLALFNVRLGWWLGNPGTKGHDTYHEAGPRNAFLAMLSEALGMTDDKSSYVYLSDGGHFENLGLFEMVLRRCRLIVVCDATADPEYRFSDLGNAVRKIRIDLGIPVVFSNMSIHKYRPGDDGGRYCAIGRIRYACADGDDAPDGVLIYFKPVLCGREPQDIQQYAAQNPAFPQESTMDQFFGESQFESYCQLGKIAVDTVLGEQPVADPSWVQDLVGRIDAHVRQTGTPQPGPKPRRAAAAMAWMPAARRWPWRYARGRIRR